LYKFPDFQHWFFEEDDNSKVNEMLSVLTEEILEQNEYFLGCRDELKSWFEYNIENLSDKIFDDENKNIYKNRLLDITYLLHSQGLELFRDIAASLAWSVAPENNYDLKTVPFFKELIKRTILEGFIRYQYKIDQLSVESNVNIKKKEKPDSTSNTITAPGKNLTEIINVLYSFK